MGHPAPLWNYVPGLSGYRNQYAKSAGVSGAKVPIQWNVVYTYCILFCRFFKSFSAQPNLNSSKKHQSDIRRTGPRWLTQKSTICNTGIQVCCSHGMIDQQQHTMFGCFTILYMQRRDSTETAQRQTNETPSVYIFKYWKPLWTSISCVRRHTVKSTIHWYWELRSKKIRIAHFKQIA